MRRGGGVDGECGERREGDTESIDDGEATTEARSPAEEEEEAGGSLEEEEGATEDEVVAEDVAAQCDGLIPSPSPFAAWGSDRWRRTEAHFVGLRCVCFWFLRQKLLAAVRPRRHCTTRLRTG